MTLGSIDDLAGHLVVKNSIILPTVPQLLDDVHEFLGHFVALGFRRMLRKTKIVSHFWIGSSNNIPGDTSAADMIDRAQHARYIVGLRISRRYGGADSDMFRN